MTKNMLIKISSSMLMIGGLLYIFIQLIHPADELSSVGTTLYFLVALMTSVMSAFVFIGILGFYVNKSEHLGILGFIGGVVFGLFWLISMMFSFIEAFILPLLTKSSTEFVVGMTGLFSQVEVSVDLGIFPELTKLAGIMYILGGMIFGISLYISKVFSKKIALMLCIAAAITVGSAFVPHPWDRVFAVPMGISLLLIGNTQIMTKNLRVKN